MRLAEYQCKSVIFVIADAEEVEEQLPHPTKVTQLCSDEYLVEYFNSEYNRVALQIAGLDLNGYRMMLG